jgi:ATP-dependent metalloprotease
MILFLFYYYRFSQTEGVIFIAATNFPELLDKALVRPGRFDRHVAVPLPDVRGRVQILSHHLKNVQLARGKFCLFLWRSELL